MGHTGAAMLTAVRPARCLAPGARQAIIAGVEGTGTACRGLGQGRHVLAASSTFSGLGLASTDIDRMIGRLWLTQATVLVQSG